MIHDQYVKYFVHLCTEYRDVMLSASKTILTGKYEGYAEDAVQNALIAVANNMSTVVNIDAEKIKGFLIRISKNKAIDIYRRESRYIKIDMEDVDNILCQPYSSPIDIILTKDGYDDIVKYITELGERYRTVMELRLINGFSEKEIAAALHLSEKTVNLRVYRGRHKLQDIIDKLNLE